MRPINGFGTTHSNQGGLVDIGPQCNSDLAFVKKCRRQQSLYRAWVLQEHCGVGPNPSSKDRFGNMLIDGEKSGSNFVSDVAFRYAKQRARDKVVCNDITLEEYRLFNNMLSSMPLCFNLFSDLRALLLTNELACAQAVKELFSEFYWIESVLYIGVEFIPVPTGYYIGDKTAFDAIIIVTDARGRRGLITIETKYTDLFGKNTSKNNDIKNDIVRRDELFIPELAQQLATSGYSQLFRNFLLTYAYAKNHKIMHWANVTISPQEDRKGQTEINELVAGLAGCYQSNVHKIDLEEFVRRGVQSDVATIGAVYKKVQKRYLEPLDAPLLGSEQ